MLYDRCLGFLLIFLFGLGFVFASSYSVCAENCDFDSISQAISNSKDGDIITVKAGNYNENVIINEEISLIAEENVYLTANSPTILINSDNVLVKGFNINPLTPDYIGIKINDSENYSISGNIINGSIAYGLGADPVEEVPEPSFLMGRSVSNGNDTVNWFWMVFVILLVFAVLFILIKKKQQNK